MSALQRVSPSLNDLMSARAVRTAAVCVLLVLLAVQGVRLAWLLVTPLGPLGTAQGATAAAPLPALQRDVFFARPPTAATSAWCCMACALAVRTQRRT